MQWNVYTAKYPKLKKSYRESATTASFSALFCVQYLCLPGDVVSMFLGAKRVPFSNYFWGSFLGTLPGIITETLIGFSITDPSSPMFWISVGLTVLINVGSVSGYVIWEHKKRKNET